MARATHGGKVELHIYLDDLVPKTEFMAAISSFDWCFFPSAPYSVQHGI